MARHFNPKSLQFYITLPAPCPYLPNKVERKIFTPLDSLNGPILNDYLTHSGFRRSQNVIYRPACENCTACQSLRVDVMNFKPSKSLKRVIAKNRDLTLKRVEAIATREQFDLLSRYLQTRHTGGGMCDMSYGRYEMMVEDCAARTDIFEYRDGEGRLVSACITDELQDGQSMVYSFFDPDMAHRSLGNYMILSHIDVCAAQGLYYLYLGYWVEGSPKMRYKSRFKPFEILKESGWKAE